ncbi:MAG: prepilin-type N-terminal cleavage/methylation domain-containing protein [Piscirickettsiaceae bacterium]|nr:prepilin-type N-terminal cleavage/methylation domain-containing protein [Piscirickettsiaceae bacterium]
MKNNAQNSQSGFTLVELSIVLVVIGIIIGAMSIGKDLQRNAIYQQINSTFVQAWGMAYQAYYDRTGIVVGDSPASPTLKVNASTTERCSTDLYTSMDAAGVSLPQGRAEGSEDAFIYLDTNGNPQQVVVCFQNVIWSIPGATSGYVTRFKNVMVIKSLTPALARFIDNQIDSRTDARFGLFRQDTQAGATTTASLEWSIDNRSRYGTTSADNLDEDQVAVVTAYYLMSQ